MIFLATTSRQYSPEEEWILLGVKNLFSEITSQNIYWAIYDKNPDLLQTKKPHHLRTHLRSNSFHQTALTPFSAVIIAGSRLWHGEEMEILFGNVAKKEIPLLALGLKFPINNQISLTEQEKTCLTRSQTLVAVSDESTKDWLRRYDLECPVLPCPSLFAFQESKKTNNEKPCIGFVLEDTQTSETPLKEDAVRNICQLILLMQKKYNVKVICLRLTDLMRFSPIFGDSCVYSYDANDYSSFIQGCDLIVTSNPEVALATNGVGRPNLFLLNAENHKDLKALPYTSFLDGKTINDCIELLLKKKGKDSEKTAISLLKSPWLTLLQNHSLFSKESKNAKAA